MLRCPTILGSALPTPPRCRGCGAGAWSVAPGVWSSPPGTNNATKCLYSLRRTDGETDMIAKRFQVGDRVKARATIGHVRAGMLGTIRRTFISIPDAYDV